MLFGKLRIVFFPDDKLPDAVILHLVESVFFSFPRGDIGAVGHAGISGVEGSVVVNNHFIIFRDMYIKFYGIRTNGYPFFHGGNGIFRHQPAGAAMAYSEEFRGTGLSSRQLAGTVTAGGNKK